MDLTVLPAPAFYAETAAYMRALDDRWLDEGLTSAMARERVRLPTVLGEAAGRKVLDCTCGSGAQAIPLAQLGWCVTGTDVTEVSLRDAAEHARREGVAVAWRRADVREIGGLFPVAFDVVVSCMALDNLLSDADLAEAARAMYVVLRSGGLCYLRMRDFDHLLAVRPRYEFREERALPDGRVIRLEDWLYEADTHVVNAWVFLREDARRAGYRWQTRLFAYRRRALQQAELERFLREAGFVGITFLPHPNPWAPYEVIARRPA